VCVRIPGWSSSKNSVSVNGKAIEAAIEPGKFLAIQRSWKDGDRIELEFDMPLRLEAIDEQNKDNVALVRGPLALFAVGNIPKRITRAQLLAARVAASSSDDWKVDTDKGAMTLRPFAAIMSEQYRLYNRVNA
jgi:DUF1680 family protein